MNCLVSLLLVILAAEPASPEQAFLERVEQARWIINKKEQQRIERNDDGEVIRLHLNHMQLAPEDFAAMGKITTLQGISLVGTNVTDEDLKQLRGLTGLKSISLTNTEVTDEAITELKLHPEMRTMCLGNVKITPAGIADLKARFPKLLLGYTQRKEE
jgi:hypothetical protein